MMHRVFTVGEVPILGICMISKKILKVTNFLSLNKIIVQPKLILSAADSVIKNNKSQVKKTLWTENNDGEQLTLIRCADEKDEAFQLAKYIKKEISKKKLSYKDFAILYRTNAQSRALEDIFYKEKIPYVIIGGVEFYRRKEVKDVIAYLRVIANQNDEESLA